MTTVEPRVFDLTGVEPEFEKPCENIYGCDNAAEWYIWASHAFRCPHNFYFCTPCKNVAEAEYLRVTQAGDTLCDVCDQPVVGQLSDHLRFIKL